MLNQYDIKARFSKQMEYSNKKKQREYCLKMGDDANNNHYNKIEEILQYISREFITVRKKDCHHVNIVLRNVVSA